MLIIDPPAAAAGTDQIQVQIEYKTSVFVHSSQSIIFNDLTNRTFVGDEDDIALLKRLAESPKTLRDMASFSDIKRSDERLDFFLCENLLVPVSQDETLAFIPHRVDIETCRQCNARCQFCPQSVSPKIARCNADGFILAGPITFGRHYSGVDRVQSLRRAANRSVLPPAR